MTTFQRTGKADSVRKITGLAMIGLWIYVAITGWKMFLENGLFLVLALGTFIITLFRVLDPFLSKPVLRIDDDGISQGGHLWPMDNWKLEWNTVTRARLFGEGKPTLIVLNTPMATKMVTEFESFDQLVQLVREQLEKRGCPLENKDSQPKQS